MVSVGIAVASWRQRSRQDFHILIFFDNWGGGGCWFVLHFSEQDQVWRRSSKDSFRHLAHSAAKKLGRLFHEFWLAEHFSGPFGPEKPLSVSTWGSIWPMGENCPEITKIGVCSQQRYRRRLLYLDMIRKRL